MKISVIIPTHNRCASLKRTLLSLKSNGHCEIVVVDNNSSDSTKSVVENIGMDINYVFESRTSFTRARDTGAESSSGDVFLFLDDDVIVERGWDRILPSVLQQSQDVGVIAALIRPEYEQTPPDWAIACQMQFNGWSLNCPECDRRLGVGPREVDSAAGPMMAVTREAYYAVGGFPPDTIGVETNVGAGAFRKLYVGPGDYGLCSRIKHYGKRIVFHPGLRCRHVIPALRMLPPFWRSRMIGEGQQLAISHREFNRYSWLRLGAERARASLRHRRWLRKLKGHIASLLSKTAPRGCVFPEELWVLYAKAYLEMSDVLDASNGLSEFLWRIGKQGVSRSEHEMVIRKMPADLKKLLEPDRAYPTYEIGQIGGMEFLELR